MAKWIKLTILEDDSQNYCAWTNERPAKYIHKDGTLHSRTDRRDDGIKHKSNGGFRSFKKLAKAINRAIKKGNLK